MKISNTELVVKYVEVVRVNSLMFRYARCRHRLFGPAEIEYCTRYKKRQEEHYAARLAAKFALRELGLMVPFKNVEILNDVLGKPSVWILGTAEPVFSVSLTHDAGWAAAAALKRENL